MARVSLRDVARRCRLSIGTVSNVINNPEMVSPDTRARVEEAITELGWSPSRKPQRPGGRGSTVGLAVRDLADPFCADLARGVQEALAEKGYHCLIGDANNQPGRQHSVVGTFLTHELRGILLVQVGTSPDDDLAAVTAARVPTVLVGGAGVGTEVQQFCTAGVDDVLGGRLAIEHLLASGRTRLGFVGEADTLRPAHDRLDGARRAARDAGADLRVVTTDGLTVEAGRQAAAELAERPPQGVFCANDLLAIGLLQGLLELGLRVPADVAIVGYDDSGFAASTAVPLSSVALPAAQLGRSAAELLLAEITDATGPHVHRSARFSPQLVVRASSGPA